MGTVILYGGLIIVFNLTLTFSRHPRSQWAHE
jgi:hypothetical protein